MKADVLWMKDGQFIARTDSGHTTIIDGPPSHGGRNLGPRPMEMVLMGLGGCTSIDVIDILKKSRQHITDCVTQLTAERASSVPAVFTKIHIHFVVSGRDLKPHHVERAIELSATKYCSATLMLQRGGVEITHDYEIIDASA